MFDNPFDSVRVISRPDTIRLTGLAPRTFDRIEAKGEGPPKTQLSERRIGYRLIDIKEWLDARRVGASQTAA
jgi:predicted DNA-binding transcriptional regulator AlpA